MEEAQTFVNKEGDPKSEILAWRYESPQDPERIARWVGGKLKAARRRLEITTPRGATIPLKVGAWVVRVEGGYFFGIENSLFEETFERVELGKPTVVEPKQDPAPSYISIGKECFSHLDRTVIFWEGQNYYLECGVTVRDHEDGGHSTCVKPVNHKTLTHEDRDGHISFEYTTLRTVRIQSLSLDKEPNALGRPIESVTSVGEE